MSSSQNLKEALSEFFGNTMISILLSRRSASLCHILALTQPLHGRVPTTRLRERLSNTFDSSNEI